MRPAVGNAPGAIATVRMPFGPHSTARLLVIASMADFAIAEGTVKARPVMVEVERMLSTTPLCVPSIQRLPAPSVQYIAPCSVGARIASAARNDRCSVCAMKVAAALLTSTSSGASRQIVVHHGIDRGAVADVASDDADLAAEIRRASAPRSPPAIRAGGRR